MTAGNAIELPRRNGAWEHARRPKVRKLAQHRRLARIVAAKLRLLWSPEQIAGWLKQRYPTEARNQVVTIYRSHFIQARGALKQELLAYLRRALVMQRSRHYTQKTDNHGRTFDTAAISERPAAAGDRAVPGHWEGNLVFGARNSQIATLLERRTRYVMLMKLDSKDTETVVNAVIQHA